MKKQIERALIEAKKAGASYADVRILSTQDERIATKNGDLDNLLSDESKGFGIRVIADGAWGFSSSSVITDSEIDRVAEEAVAIAKASATVAHDPVKLADNEVHQADVPANVKDDPRNIPIAQRVKFALDVDKTMKKDGIVSRSVRLFNRHEDKYFGSSEGAMIYQEDVKVGGGMAAYASNGKEIAQRSYPSSFGGVYSRDGWSYIKKYDLKAHGERVAEEAIQILSAKPCPKGKKDIVIEGSQLVLQLHESIGHPVELDRVFGTEAAFAGKSFVKTDMMGKFRYGSDIVNVTADATIPNAFGGFAYDDDGVKGERVFIIKDGIFQRFLDSREDAAKLGMKSMGANRASSWNRIPIVRMVSVNLEPGNSTFDELIGGIEDGIYVSTVLTWSIDDMRLNFQFTTELGWEIKNGKLGEMIQRPTYTGISYDFWRSCDAIGNKDLWKVWGVPNCGKGEPMQAMHVSHGVSPARFRQVQVGV
ncbi:MAG: TldD/PmbA family protein [Caldisericia bacterium]|nr:TldD/PmbA family protein [Caldisericia bacterium]